MRSSVTKPLRRVGAYMARERRTRIARCRGFQARGVDIGAAGEEAGREGVARVVFLRFLDKVIGVRNRASRIQKFSVSARGKENGSGPESRT